MRLNQYCNSGNYQNHRSNLFNYPNVVDFKSKNGWIFSKMYFLLNIKYKKNG